MSVSHVENFNYSDWRISVSQGDDVYSSGTSPKTSNLYPISKVIGNITASVTGGYGWIAAYVQGESNPVGTSLYCVLKATLYLVASNNQRIAVASASGSAGRGGTLNVYEHATTGTLTFDTSTLTEEQKRLYEAFQIEYECTTSSSHVHIDRIGAFADGRGASPTGTASITIRDTINVDYDEVEMTNLFFDGDEMSGLYFDGNPIF